MAVCRSCDAPVIFVPSATSGKNMILNAEPTKGVIVMADQFVLAKTKVPTSGRDDRAGYGNPDRRVAKVVDVFTDHHATCIYADQWKGRSRDNPPGD